MVNRIEKIQRDFIWGSLRKGFKYHPVGRSKVCSPFLEGLGICNLRLSNQALLGKWLWLYVNESDAWWKAIVDAKYGCNWGGWCSVDPSGSYGVGLWKYIRRGWRIFSSHTRFDLGDGMRIKFWDNVWCGEICLKIAFPLLYNIGSVKEAFVATNMYLSSGTIHWNINFIRLAHDWEVEMLASFYSLLYSFRGKRGGVDKLWWILSHKGIFDVRSFYKILAHKDNPSFPWKSI